MTLNTSTATTEAEAKARFEADTTDHTMKILHSDGLYRHLRFRKPGTGMYGYDLITWPGYLTITGDMGTWTFRRTEDMFEFFRATPADRINAGYWAEKLQTGDSSGRDAAKAYSEDTYRQLVTEHVTEYAQGLSPNQAKALWDAVNRDLLDTDSLDYPGSHHDTAREAIANFTHMVREDPVEVSPGQYRVMVGKVAAEFEFTDSWEWDLTGYSLFFLWCCYAIRSGVKQYDDWRLMHPAPGHQPMRPGECGYILGGNPPTPCPLPFRHKGRHVRPGEEAQA